MASELEAVRTAEKHGYSKGYAAGQRRAARTTMHSEVARTREAFIQQMMIAIAPELIAHPWAKKVNGEHKPFCTASEIMGNVRDVAEKAAARCDFYLTATIHSMQEADHDRG